MTVVRTILVVTTAAVVSVPISAQTPAPDAAAPHQRIVEAIRVAEGEIHVDGRLDEPAWQAAPVASDFTQAYPRPGEPATERSEVRVVFDDDNLYVGIRLFDNQPERISAPLARRDATGLHSDWVHVIIDSRADRRTAFGFSVNPRGVQRDVYHYGDQYEDDAWVGVWDASTEIDEEGWTAEIRIPLSQLRFDAGDAAMGSWGFQVMRDLAREGERTVWAPWTRTDPGFVSRFGTLTGLHGFRATRGVEIVPYLSASLMSAPPEGGVELGTGARVGVEAGADIQMGLPSALTLTATLNPDFGQVEADPAEVNLTAHETHLQERRRFFTESADMFEFGAPIAFSTYGIDQFFYSRRIGHAPQRSLATEGDTHVDQPQQTRILGAAKVSGRTPEGWSVGLLDAVTAEERARVIRADGEEESVIVEPLSNYLVARLQRELRGGQTMVGGLLTGTHRSLDEEMSGLFHRDAYVAGADVLHTWADRAWRFNGHVALSRVGGDAAAIARTQADPARYFQRPDAPHLDFDPMRTTLSGHHVDLSLVHASDWMASIQLKEVSPGFELNDVGFQTRADARSVVGFLGRRIDTPLGVLRDQLYYLTAFQGWNFAGDRILAGGSATGEWTFENHWRAGLTVIARPEHADDRLTRGGPLAAAPSQRESSAWIESDPRRSLRGRLAARDWADASGAYQRHAELRFTYQPVPAVRVELAPQFSRQRTTAQYVTTAAGAESSRYVFADLMHRTAAAEARFDWTFAPNLSLQVVAQPFISTGDYRSFKEFTTPGALAFDVYGDDRGTICHREGTVLIDPVASISCAEAKAADFPVQFADPDFHVTSLRTNAVLRWEYRPGSTLFLVWQQDRSGFAPHGDLRLADDLLDLLQSPSHHVVRLKATYWFGR